MAYKAVTQIRVGGDSKSDVDLYERGDTVKKSDFDEGEWEDLVAAKSVLPEDEFDLAFPKATLGVNQASGTPSNLEQVQGTTLQAEKPEEVVDPPAEPAALNPADPPEVKDAGTAKGFDTKGATGKTKPEDVKGPGDGDNK